MFTLAHLSDLHLAAPPRLAQLLSKRGLGYINWLRQRRKIHRPEVLDAITRDLKAQGFDHLAVTGDLVNLSLPDEYARARRWLQTVGQPTDVTAIPGNHDVYVRGVEQGPGEFWADYMRGDDGLQRFPFIRRRGQVALIALSSGVPTAPFLATGRLGAGQLSRLADALDQTRGLFRLVLIHHPPVSPLRRYLRRLTDAPALRGVLAAKGAELVIHGHDHRRALIWLDGPQGAKIPAVGVPSASAAAPHGGEDSAGYNLYRIDRQAGGWSCEMIERQRDADAAIGEIARQALG
ncbi:MAG TPA: metallophosphoesterase [Xanthobacteraceae bacterium]|nr:metallophosphoesterase [Xanthobacteraceae bacterium]